MGINITEHADGFIIRGPQQLRAAEVSSHSDHRLAMSLAVAALLAQGDSTICCWDVVHESFPGFADNLRGLGVEIH